MPFSFAISKTHLNFSCRVLLQKVVLPRTLFPANTEYQDFFDNLCPIALFMDGAQTIYIP